MIKRILKRFWLLGGLCLRSIIPWRPFLSQGNAPLPVLSTAREILVLRLDEIGDFILTSAFLRELRRNAPRARITLVVNKVVLPLAKNCPYVTEVIAFETREFGGNAREIALRRIRAWWLGLTYFSKRKFDLVLLPRRGPDFYGAEFLAHLWAGGASIVACRNRVGLSVSGPRPLFSTAHYFVNPQDEHEVRHTLHFLSWLGGEYASEKLEVWLTEEDRTAARDLLKSHFSGESPLVVIHPSGGRSPLKQWPIEKFQALLADLRRLLNINCVVVGGGDEPWIRELFPSGSTGLLNLAGQLELTKLAAILAEADLFIGGDTGPMHLAAAAGTPVVAIFGSTSQIRFRPYSPLAEVVSLELECSPDRAGTLEDRCKICIYDHPRCLTELPVELVTACVLKRLQA